MGVDNSSITSGGRKSVRVTSHKAYNTGLVVLDVAHMPEGCGTWPAFVSASLPTPLPPDLVMTSPLTHQCSG